MKKYVFSWLFVGYLSSSLIAQVQNPAVSADTVTARAIPNTDLTEIRPNTVKPDFRPETYIVPATLMTAGLLTQGQLSRHVRAEVLAHYPAFHSSVDDYLQYAPAAAILSLGAAGVKGKHTFGDQVALTVLSNVVSQGIAQTLKYTVAYPRPDGNGHESFPSGHTTNAFTGASVLAHEYGGQSVWYAVAGYATATTVAGFRVVKNRHWMADVLFGAGLGIGSTELVYQLYPWLKHVVVGRKNTVLVPTYNGSSAGITLISVF